MRFDSQRRLPWVWMMLLVALAFVASACSSTDSEAAQPETPESTIADEVVADGVESSTDVPPFQVDWVSVSADAGAFLHQNSGARKAKLCMNGGDSAPVACFELADVDVDLSDPSYGAVIDDGPWRIYDVALTGKLDLGTLSNVRFEAEPSNGASYKCPDPTGGDYPRWGQVRRALRQFGLDLYEASAAGGQPSADKPFDVTIFQLNGEAFEFICDEAPGLRIKTISAPGAARPEDLIPRPDSIDPNAPLAVYFLEPGAPVPEALLTGTLEIEDRCVYIQPEDEQRQRYFVLFSSTSTFWDADTNAVLSGGDTLSAFVDGDRVDIGGATSSGSLDDVDWVLPPDPSCDTSVRWAGTTMSS